MVHPDDVHWFITLDETHHPYSTEGDKGGPREQRMVTVSLPRAGEPVITGNGHATGVYGFTLGCEPLPPLIIYDSNAKHEKNFAVNPEWTDGLPEVYCKYGLEKQKTYGSGVSVRRNGGMTSSLWRLYVRRILRTINKGRMSKIPVRDPLTKKLIRGPVICKTDGGPGRLATELEDILFR